MPENYRKINHLNIIKDDQPADQNLDEEQLRIFSNTRFYDLDMGQNTDIGTTVDELLMQQEKEIQFPQKPQPVDEAGPSSSSSSEPLHRGFDFDELQQFSLAGDIPGFPYGGYNESTPAELHTAHRQSWYKGRHEHMGFGAGAMPAPSVGGGAGSIPGAAPLHPELPIQGPQGPAHAHAQAASAHASGTVTPVHGSSGVGAGLAGHESAVDERLSTQRVAEEDKRRRNTAASARFRIKKKLKEQELQRNTKQMQARIGELEGKVRQLEMENKWLKNLVVERNEARDVSSIEQLRQRVLGDE